MSTEPNLSPYWKPVPVDCFMPECVGCGCNIFQEGQAEYIGFGDDSLGEAMSEWESCPKCMWPLNESEEDYIRDTLEEEGCPAQNMPLTEVVPIWRERVAAVRKANAERAREKRYGVKVTQYGE